MLSFLGLAALGPQAYISGKSPMPILQLLYINISFRGSYLISEHEVDKLSVDKFILIHQLLSSNFPVVLVKLKPWQCLM